jgi:hypothetical protein
VNLAKKQFSNVQNEYELMFERDTVIEPVSLPHLKKVNVSAMKQLACLKLVSTLSKLEN